MNRVMFKSVLALAASLLVPPSANASGFIVVDPAFGVPAAAIGMVPSPMPTPIRPPAVRATRARTRSSVNPPVPSPSTHLPVLHGYVSIGLSLKSEDVRVDIKEQVAKTYVSQTFFNNTDRDLAGTYLFPLPDDTTFSSFSLQIDGKPVEGKILEANEARQQYEQIVRRMVDPGLLEYADYKTVRARIFPIPAHGTKKVELEYTQVLRAENGMLKYRFPLKSDVQSGPVDDVKVDVRLASSQGLRTIWSPSHTISAQRSGDLRAKVSLLENNVVPNKDFLLYYSVSNKELAANLLSQKTDGEYGHFLLTLTPPIEVNEVVGKDIVLIADTSGSMQGDKLDQCKKALKHIVGALHASDRFNIIEFNTDVEDFKLALVPATAANKKDASSFIDSLSARGGTNISDALRAGKALLSESPDRPAYLVFITDGQPTVGDTDISSLLKAAANARDIRIFDFGVGYDVNTKLLNKLAKDNHGTSQYVEPDEDLETALSGFYQKIKSPVLSDVKIAYDGVEVKDVYPRDVKDIFAGSQELLLGKYKGAGKAVVRLSGKVNGVAKTYSFPITFASNEVSHTYLPRLWAMRRIGYLTEIAQENGNNAEIVDEIIALSKQYGIISAYTSFLVTDPTENQRLNPARLMPQPRHAWSAGGGGAAGPAAVVAPPAGFAVAPNIARPSDVGAPASVAAAVDMDFGPYMAAIQRQVRRNWFPPKGAESRRVTVNFTVDRSGRTSKEAIAHSSGSALSDEAALRAVHQTTLRPLPMGAPQSIDVQYSFDYNAFSEGGTGYFRAIDPADGGIMRKRLANSLANSDVSGKTAVRNSRALNDFKAGSVISEADAPENSGVKTIADKTFYFRDGVWTDSSYASSGSRSPKLIKFASQAYFDLLHQLPGISKYLAAGRQIILVYKGVAYEIFEGDAARPVNSGKTLG